ncbi:MAG: cobalt-precorrin-5B (C(1))-methyltransferase CbiD [Trichlorobacter sp.]|nr:cobalt-precorrin-5B (C(1))-methyltransferase CbiD [Trichlorobacter sp.]
MNKELRGGYTTGSCAAAAAQAATLALFGQPVPSCIELALPDNSRVLLPVEELHCGDGWCSASVRKDAGDDPDVTNGSVVVAVVSLSDASGITFRAGEGVGTVTLPGLAIPPGEPAINPAPRRMIEQAVRQVTGDDLIITIAIPGGKELAAKTFNPRLGIVGGLSVLGTTGRVRPFSHEAVQETIRCSLDIALACGIKALILVPGNIGARAAAKHFQISEHQLVEVGNEWGYLLKLVAVRPLARLLLLGHPGKLVKLAAGQWDTHSARSDSALPLVIRYCKELFGNAPAGIPTVEGLFQALDPAARQKLGDMLADAVAAAVVSTFTPDFPVMVVLTDNNGDWLGGSNNITLWKGSA